MRQKTFLLSVIAAAAVVAGVSSCDKGNQNTPGPDGSGTGVETVCPFSKGVNLDDWFLHEEIQYVKQHKYTDRDFKNIRSLGVDVVRIPIYFSNFAKAANDYVLDADFLTELDYAVDLAEQNGMYIILDNHSYLNETFPSYGEEQLTKVWDQISKRYAGRSDKVVYELQNEPGGTFYEQDWLRMQSNYLSAIRANDTAHWVVVTPVHGEALSSLPQFEDRKLIYTFHFYEPFLFTHQGATWLNPTLEIDSVPFPYDSSMPDMPTGWSGTANEQYYTAYLQEGTLAYVRSLLDTHINFAKQRNVPVYCGEFGVLNSTAEDRHKTTWIQVVTSRLNNNNIAWTWWSYRGDFAIYEKGSGLNFDTDLNTDVVEALGFKLPDGYDSGSASEIVLYDDVLPNYAKNGSWNGKDDTWYQVSYENTTDPFEGSKSILWTVGHNYGAVTFEMWPQQDWTNQAEAGYSLTFVLRTSTEFSGDLVVRVVEYSDDRPAWRFGGRISNADLPSDGQWHRFTWKLSELQNLGANAPDWHEPDNSVNCDWSLINKLEFAAEGNDGLVGKSFGIDDVRICK